MMMRILKANEIDTVSWTKFVVESPFSSPFQSRLFYDFFNSVTGLSAEAYAVEQQGNLVALCVVTFQKEKGLKGYFSRRAIIYGGPLIESGNTEALRLLLKEINADLKNKVIYTETRNFNDYSHLQAHFLSGGWAFEPYLNYHLNCSTEEIVNQNLNTNRKRQIKKALKNGVRIEEAKDLREVSDYYVLLKDLYTNKIKKPLFDFEFFKLFFEQKVGKILLVKHEGKVIGGIVCPVLDNKTIYEFYICGQDELYKELSPSVMATYGAIQFGFENNLKKFDFMGAGKQGEDYGVRDFKAKFGGELVQHGRFIKVHNKVLFGFGKLALAILQKIKK